MGDDLAPAAMHARRHAVCRPPSRAIFTRAAIHSLTSDSSQPTARGRCLNHSLGGLVAVYDKHDYLTERRKALELWSAKIAALEKGEAFNVVPFKRTANE